MRLVSVAYESVAVRAFAPADLEALLFDARARNAHEGVTGVLFVAGTRFFQYLEGPPGNVDVVLGRIHASRRHTDIHVLCRAPIARRVFDTWHMGFAQVPEGLLARFSQSDWQVAARIGHDTFERVDAMRLLLDAIDGRMAAGVRVKNALPEAAPGSLPEC